MHHECAKEWRGLEKATLVRVSDGQTKGSEFFFCCRCGRESGSDELCICVCRARVLRSVKSWKQSAPHERHAITDSQMDAATLDLPPFQEPVPFFILRSGNKVCLKLSNHPGGYSFWHLSGRSFQLGNDKRFDNLANIKALRFHSVFGRFHRELVPTLALLTSAERETCADRQTAADAAAQQYSISLWFKWFDAEITGLSAFKANGAFHLKRTRNVTSLFGGALLQSFNGVLHTYISISWMNGHWKDSCRPVCLCERNPLVWWETGHHLVPTLSHFAPRGASSHSFTQPCLRWFMSSFSLKAGKSLNRVMIHLVCSQQVGHWDGNSPQVLECCRANHQTAGTRSTAGQDLPCDGSVLWVVLVACSLRLTRDVAITIFKRQRYPHSSYSHSRMTVLFDKREILVNWSLAMKNLTHYCHLF